MKQPRGCASPISTWTFHSEDDYEEKHDTQRDAGGRRLEIPPPPALVELAGLQSNSDHSLNSCPNYLLMPRILLVQESRRDEDGQQLHVGVIVIERRGGRDKEEGIIVGFENMLSDR